MTYCLAIHTQAGLVLCSDSRLAPTQNTLATPSNMHRFIWPGNRFFTLLSAGHINTVTAVMAQIRQDLSQAQAFNLLNASHMQAVADYVAAMSANIQQQQASLSGQTGFEATFILAGQIGTQAMETLLIYPQGNFIHESDFYPYLQIGEIKYGKPILDRVAKRELNLAVAARCALVSMNSAMRSDTSVGPPIELLIYQKDALAMSVYMSIDEKDDFSRKISQSWDSGLINALLELPRFAWEL